jgi:hypothetical protein
MAGSAGRRRGPKESTILVRRRPFVIKRFAMMIAGLAAMLGVAGLAGAQDDKPTIKQAMGKLHRGPTSAISTVKKGLAADAPDWKGVQKSSKLIADLSATITELEPPKGDQADYTKQSKAYASNAKLIFNTTM